jgi:aminoglycoside phosphotransferase (APT) family kinase protein
VVSQYADLRGIDVSDIDWYLVFADFKVAVILEGIHARHLQGHTEGKDFAEVGEMVGPLLVRALDRASASSVPGLRR